MAKNPKILLAEFDTTKAIVDAARKVREAGYKKFDAHAPFPVHGLDKAMGVPESPIGWIVLAAGISGCAFALWLQWWVSVVAYPLIIGGKPYFSWQAFVPICFELTILFSAFASLGGILYLNGLPRWNHTLLNHPNMRRATDDKFFISIEANDPKFDETATRALLEQAGGKHIALLEAP